jgi:hypothetical protein
VEVLLDYNSGKSVFYGFREEVDKWQLSVGIEGIDKESYTGGCDRRTWTQEAEESPLLETVAREWLGET